MSEIPIGSENIDASMFTISPESLFYGGPSIPLGYQSLTGTFSRAASAPQPSTVYLVYLHLLFRE